MRVWRVASFTSPLWRTIIDVCGRSVQSPHSRSISPVNPILRASCLMAGENCSATTMVSTWLQGISILTRSRSGFSPCLSVCTSIHMPVESSASSTVANRMWLSSTPRISVCVTFSVAKKHLHTMQICPSSTLPRLRHLRLCQFSFLDLKPRSSPRSRPLLRSCYRRLRPGPPPLGRSPLGRSVFGRASLTFRVRPSTSLPLRAAIALTASSSLLMSTNPNPLGFPCHGQS